VTPAQAYGHPDFVTDVPIQGPTDEGMRRLACCWTRTRIPVERPACVDCEGPTPMWTRHSLCLGNRLTNSGLGADESLALGGSPACGFSLGLDPGAPAALAALGLPGPGQCATASGYTVAVDPGTGAVALSSAFGDPTTVLPLWQLAGNLQQGTLQAQTGADLSAWNAAFAALAQAQGPVPAGGAPGPWAGAAPSAPSGWDWRQRREWERRRREWEWRRREWEQRYGAQPGFGPQPPSPQAEAYAPQVSGPAYVPPGYVPPGWPRDWHRRPEWQQRWRREWQRHPEWQQRQRREWEQRRFGTHLAPQRSHPGYHPSEHAAFTRGYAPHYAPHAWPAAHPAFGHPAVHPSVAALHPSIAAAVHPSIAAAVHPSVAAVHPSVAASVHPSVAAVHPSVAALVAAGVHPSVAAAAVHPSVAAAAVHPSAATHASTPHAVTGRLHGPGDPDVTSSLSPDQRAWVQHTLTTLNDRILGSSGSSCPTWADPAVHLPAAVGCFQTWWNANLTGAGKPGKPLRKDGVLDEDSLCALKAVASLHADDFPHPFPDPSGQFCRAPAPVAHTHGAGALARWKRLSTPAQVGVGLAAAAVLGGVAVAVARHQRGRR